MTRNGLPNSFIEFFKNIFVLILLCFLGNKMCNFYDVLLTRYKLFEGVSKRFLKYFVEIQKTMYQGL